MLGPVSSHTAAKTRQVVASLKSQPTVAGHSGDHPPDLETLRATPARPHQIVIQGNLYGWLASETNEPERLTTARRLQILGASRFRQSCCGPPAPDLYRWPPWRRDRRRYRRYIIEHMMHGDSRAAIVVSVDP